MSTAVLVDPLIKIPFILANVYATHVSVRPPRPTANSNEQEKYKQRKETSDGLSNITWLTVPTCIITNFLFGACDIYMILSAVYPELQVPLLHKVLLPSPATAPKASDYYLTSIFLFGCLLVYAGSLLRYVCYRTLGRHFTFQLSLQKEHKLITEGPYSFVRHPSYLGMAIGLPGMFIAQLFSPGAWWVESGMWRTWQGQTFGVFWVVFTLWICWALLSRVPKEDLMLKMQFREQWHSWSQKTKYAVIPYIW